MASTAAPMEQDPPANPRSFDGVPDYPPIVVAPPPENVGDFDKTGPRLMITHIENDNFKSYAGITVLGPFHKSFSSIVGPNGSGKSNVIDSMLFVFGYRATKIRSKKLSVLIHNSDQHRNLTNCTVRVFFQKIIDTGDGDDDFDIVPNSKFVVSRTAFKDNSSYYKINDKKATYKEMGTMLRSNGVDLDHNRFLILQGEVEQISLMKPKAPSEHEDGMLEYLEDIIGTNRFKEPIIQLTQRVEELNEFREEKLNRVKVVEKEKDSLEGVKNEAVEYLTMKNDHARKDSVLCQIYMREFMDMCEKATKQKQEIDDGMKENKEKMNALNKEMKKKGKERNAINDHCEELTKKCDEKKDEFTKFEQEDVRCREDLKHAKGRAKKLDKTIEQEKQKLSELEMIPEKTQKDLEHLEKKLKKQEAEKAEEESKLQEVMESLKTETKGLQEEKDAKEQELLELQKGVNDTKSKYNVAQSEMDVYMSRQQGEESKLRETNKNLENVTTKLKDRKTSMEHMGKGVPESQQMLEKAQKDLDDAVSEENKLAEEVRQSRVHVEEARSSLQAARSHGKVQESLDALKRSGRVPGIHGRLGDLGAIDEKYDVAISTACGPLDNVVVDSIDIAQKCVEFLKKNSIGSATFIALDKMARWKQNCQQKIKTPENVPRLFDLIKVKDEGILPAFYYAVKDTLVANDLDQATRIAYGKNRFRVVTLDGQLIDQSGTMSGGGKRVSKGRMGSSVITEVDPKQLEKWESDLEKGTITIQRIRETKMLLSEKVEKVNRTLRDLRHGMDKFSMEITSLEEQRTSLTKQVTEQEARVKSVAPDKAKMKSMEKSVEVFKKDYDKALSKASTKEEEVHTLHKEIMAIGRNKLKGVEARIDLIQNQIDQVMGLITKANVAVKTAKRNTEKTEKKVKSLEEEIVENKKHLEELDRTFKRLEEDATTVLTAFRAAQEEMGESEKQKEDIEQQMEQLAEEQRELNKMAVEVKHELDKYDTVARDAKKKYNHWEARKKKISVESIESQEEEPLVDLPAEELREMSKEDAEYACTILEEKLNQLNPNIAAIAEYRKKEEHYLKRVSELDQITDMRDQQRKQHESLRKQRLDEFMAGFGIITNKLKEMYQMITLGGDAELELVDSLDPFSEGIVFSVRPPKKSWKNISNLSGGEKTLSSLALVFALHHYKPTPLYVMDEIDAALDFKNVSIVAHYIKERTKNAQFIIISLRNNMFELADRLIGIYKTYDSTKTVTINPSQISIPLQTVDTNMNTSRVSSTS